MIWAARRRRRDAAAAALLGQLRAELEGAALEQLQAYGQAAGGLGAALDRLHQILVWHGVADPDCPWIRDAMIAAEAARLMVEILTDTPAGTDEVNTP